MESTVADRSEAGRARPASLAYRLLVSAADADDIVQDAYLRWHAADRERIRVKVAASTVWEVLKDAGNYPGPGRATARTTAA